jgi:DNA polymerase III sliding clamp (beta) subunit (PCNA family)
MEIKDLRLALSATPKKPHIRYYLNGINVTSTHVRGSNVHVLCHINTFTNDIPGGSITVPVETINELFKKMGSKHEDEEVEIILIDNQYQLQCMNEVEVFTPVDHKYPEFKKIIEPLKLNDHDKNLNAIQHQFNWDYVAAANAALCKYFGNTTPKRLYSFELAGYMMPSDDVIYVIMPCRL